MKPELLQSQRSISPKELYRRRQEGLPSQIIDVRTPPEYAAIHVEGVDLLPLDRLDAAAFLRQSGARNDPLYVICQSGARAAKAIEKFEKAGFDNCVLVTGGTQAWEDAKLPVERGRSNVLPLMRQVQIVAGFITAFGASLAIWIDPWFALVPLVIGAGLLFAGLSGSCGLALLLAKMPWNRESVCSTGSCRR